MFSGKGASGPLAGSSAVLTVVSIPRQISTAETTGRSQSQNADFTRSDPLTQAWRHPLATSISSNPPRRFAHRPGPLQTRFRPRPRGSPERRIPAGLAAPGSPRIRTQNKQNTEHGHAPQLGNLGNAGGFLPLVSTHADSSLAGALSLYSRLSVTDDIQARSASEGTALGSTRLWSQPMPIHPSLARGARIRGCP